jgi:hypothetical protein
VLKQCLYGWMSSVTAVLVWLDCIAKPVTTSHPAHYDVATRKQHSIWRPLEASKTFFVTPVPLQAVRLRFVGVEVKGVRA